ncbi:MAG: hypothetical protein MZV64_49045 [Ignavibacteriales bacterium]|nr:hypothetical protein [Ignavibacteriales bacterium]
MSAAEKLIMAIAPMIANNGAPSSARTTRPMPIRMDSMAHAPLLSGGCTVQTRHARRS